MRNEVAHIDDDREALNWAIGSVRAGLAARLNDLPRQRIFSARSAGIVWIVIFIVSSAFNLSIALSARLGYEQITSVLGRGLKGFDYARFQSLAEAMPIGLFVLMAVVVFAYVLSLYLNLQRRPYAFLVFCCAMALSFGAWLIQLAMPTYLQAISTPHRWRVGVCFVLTAAILIALRSGSHGSSGTHGRSPPGSSSRPLSEPGSP